MPEKHHYFPIFYQKRWAGIDGRVCVYSKPHNELKAVRRHPARVGFQNDLYTVPGVEFEAASQLERRFFLRADNDAAEALAVLGANPGAALDERLRSGWARFVMSLIHRAPEEVAAFFVEIGKITEDAERRFQENYSTLRRANEPETFEEFKRTRPSNPGGRAAVILIQRVIDSQFVGDHFVRMIWTILQVSGAYPFLTSDRPILMTNGIANPGSHLALPIGPRRLFIASNERAIVNEIEQRNPDEIVSFVNDRIVRQARRFVVGVDDRQLRFVGKRFGERLPSSPTERQRPRTPDELDALASIYFNVCR